MNDARSMFPPRVKLVNPDTNQYGVLYPTGEMIMLTAPAASGMPRNEEEAVANRIARRLWESGRLYDPVQDSEWHGP